MLESRVILALFAAPLIPISYAAFIFIRWVFTKWRIAARVHQIPGPPGTLVYGNLGQFSEIGEERLRDWHLGNCLKYRTAWSFRIGPFVSAVTLCHPATVKILLKTSEPKQHSDGTGYTLIEEWLGKGLLVNNGLGWFRNRRLLTPAFHFDVLKPYTKIYNEAADIFMEKMSSEIIATKGSAIEIFKPVSLCTLNVMLRCAFSYDADIQREGTENPYVSTVGKLSQLVLTRMVNPLIYSDFIYHRTAAGKEWQEGCRYAHDVAYDLMKQRRKQLAHGDTAETIKSKRAVDFLDILLLAKDDNGQGLTDLEIRSEVDTFLFEGHDTTASAITWTLFLLASHPQYQAKAREEVDGILEGRDSDNIEWDDLSRLSYLTLCVKESLRHTPPVPVMSRELENPMEIDGVTLLPGTFLAVHVYSVHHNPDIWGDDHMEYKPDRFLHENIKGMDSYAFIPFSAGPRNCIGQNFAMNEIKTVVARVLRRFELSIDPDIEVGRQPTLVMKSENGVYVKFTER